MRRAVTPALLGASLLLIGSLALAQDDRMQVKQPRAIAAGNPYDGRMVAIGGLYGEQRIGCVQCHGLDGAGDTSGAFPRLSGQSAWYLYKTLHEYAAGLRPNDIMGPIAKTLTDQQKQNVAAYYSSVTDAPSHSDVNATVPMRQNGGAIAAVGVPSQGVPACNGCHGADGQGAPPIYPFLAGQSAPYTRHQLMLWKAGKRSGDPMNIMEIIAKAMTQEQIDAVAVYYAALKPAPANAAAEGRALSPGDQRAGPQIIDPIGLRNPVGPVQSHKPAPGSPKAGPE